MGSVLTFYDYIDADGSGDNVIRSWLNGPGKDAKAHFNIKIPYLEASPPHGVSGSNWGRPITGYMHDEWKGFVELCDKAKRNQYRILAKVEGREVFLVACGTHSGTYTTDVTAATAKTRVLQMKADPARYRREHEYD